MNFVYRTYPVIAQAEKRIILKHREGKQNLQQHEQFALHQERILPGQDRNHCVAVVSFPCLIIEFLLLGCVTGGHGTSLVAQRGTKVPRGTQGEKDHRKVQATGKVNGKHAGN